MGNSSVKYSAMILNDCIYRISAIERNRLIVFAEEVISQKVDLSKDFDFTGALRNECQTLASRFGWFLNESLSRCPYAALIKNVPLAICNELQLAISGLLGNPTSGVDFHDASLVYELRPARDAIVLGRTLNESLHTDGTASRHPNRFTILGCLRPDQHGGGRSCLLHVNAILETCPPEVLHDIQDHTFPWRIGFGENAQVFRDTVLSTTPLRLRWMLHSIESACEILGEEGAWDLKSAKAFDAFLSGVTCSNNFLLDSGDMLFINNEKTLHSRTGILEPSTSTRRVLRTKVA